MKRAKFKFWLGHTKKMTYPHTIDEINKIIPEFTKDIIELQFTGLKDKNGKEIYEGDLFMNGESIRIIEIMGGNTHAITPDRTQSILLSFIIKSNPKNEVVGNIYENSGLIK